jgi:hypothetical protein
MTKLNTKARSPVTPSSRDSISTWLDVLTAMLIMPEPQRTQVRDELEDHLRSRVDDLLIIGKPEPEAVQIAVAELGETAELAKLITHAHTRINPRRKIMNAALITVALAGMSFGGISFINSTGAPGASPNDGGAIPVVIPSEREEQHDSGAPETALINLEDEPMLFAFQKIAAEFGYRIEVDSLPVDAARVLQNTYISLDQQITLESVLELIKLSVIDKGIQITFEVGEGTIEMMTTTESIRRSVVTRVYQIQWAKPQMLETVQESMYDMISVSTDTHMVSIKVVGNGILVTAPKSLQSKVDEVWALINKQVDEQFHEEEIIRRSEKQRRLEALDRLQAEFQEVREELLQHKNELREVTSRIHELTRFDPQFPLPEEKKSELEGLNHIHSDLEFNLDEIEERYIYLRSRLIESQYAQLFEGID